MTNYQRINSALSFVPVDDRDTWLRMGMAINSELGDSGFDIWDNWSQQSASYIATDAQDVWKSIKPGGGITIGTLYHEAKANGWQDDITYQPPSHEELAERKRLAEERTNLQEAAIQQERQQAADKAAAILNHATAAPAPVDNPYLVRKKVAPVETLLEIEASEAASILGYQPKSSGDHLNGRLLVVPIKQSDTISTLELIDGTGRKTALAGRGTKSGAYWTTQRLPSNNGQGITLLIGEGVATVLSASQATRLPGIAALSSSNLPTVAKVIREQYPTAELVILADLVKTDGTADPHAIAATKAVGGKLAVPDFGSNRDTHQTDFNDMAVAIGNDAVKQTILSTSQTVKTWPEPQPLTGTYSPEIYPVDALPDKVRAAVEEVQGFVKAPLPMVSSSAIAALSLAIQALVDVKRAEKLHGPTGLFLLTIADSGERKSTCDGYFTKAIREHEKKQKELSKPAINRFKADSEAWEAKKTGIKEKIRHQAKNGQPTEAQESALRDLEREKPEQRKVPRLIYADATPEALAFGLAKQWPSGGVVSAEAGIVFGSHGMGRDSVMRNLATLNQLWDGNSLTIDRRTSESFTVTNARLTIALQVQEPTIKQFFNKSGELARGTGFLARFLISWPETTQGSRFFTEAPNNWTSLEAFNHRLSELLNHPVTMDDDGLLTPIMLSLSPEAKRAWVEYHDTIENELAYGGELYDIRDVASKIADNAVRLATIFQVFEHGISSIGADCFERASQITTWHLFEARRFFGELALPSELADAARLDSWLIDHCRRERVKTVNKRHLQQHGPIRDGERLSKAIKELIELDRLQLTKEGRRTDLAVNPALLEIPE